MSDINSKNFTVYRSSAGSGKTYTLVKEYLQIVLTDPARFRNILAVTFTNKAASEMKERVLLRLEELGNISLTEGNDNSHDLLESLLSDTKLTREQIIFNSQEALSLILHNYSDFSISTIDSFVHRVIRSFAIDLDLAMNFEVEIDADELVAKCIDLLLDKAGKDKELTKVLLNFIKYKSSEDRNLNIDYDLMNFAKHLNKEVVQNYLDDFRKLTPKDFEQISRKTKEFIREFETSLTGRAKEAIKLIDDKGIPIAAFYQKNRGIYSYFKKFSIGDFKKLDPNNYVKVTVEENKWTSGDAIEDDKNKIEELSGVLASVYDDILEILAQGRSRYYTYQNLNKNIYQLSVLNQIEKVIEEFKSQKNLVLISEFNKKISDIVLSEPVPFIYERLGERYKHFFIDEFQDTSILQWMNLLPLLDNSLSEGNFNMLVGDGKQAIYRFRNGEVEQFVNLPEITDDADNPIIKEREDNLKRYFNEESLATNYRSRKEIVEFNNSLFDYIYKNILTEDIRAVYENSIQEVNANNSGGFVSIDFFEKERSSGSLFDEKNHERILEIIKHQLELGYDYKDIAILCRKKKYGNEIANYLAINNIPIVSSESLLLAYSPSVSFLIACMKLISNPDDGILQEEVKQFLSNNGKLTKGDVENSFPPFGGKNTVARLSSLPVYDLCEEMIRMFSLNKETDPYIHYFLDVLFDFTLKGNSGINDFLLWWDENKEKPSLIIPEETNAVRIMTIHKAKGLEFPVVIFPYANERVRFIGNVLWIPNNDDLISDLPFLMLNAKKNIEDTEYADFYHSEESKSLLDLLNLLYVVMTRAVDNLYVISQKAEVKESSSETDNSKVHTILRDFVRYHGDWSEEKNHYSYGEETMTPVEKKQRSDSKYSLENSVSEDWRKRAMISKRAPEIWDMQNPDRNRLWGNLVHTLMSKIKYSGDKESVLEKFYQDGYFDLNKKRELSVKIDEVLSNDLIRPYFEEGHVVKAEAEILLPDGKSYRPDRVVVDGEKAVVIDYKTGKSVEYHRTQLNHYATLLEDMGYEVDKKILIYIDEEVDIVEV